MVIPDSVLLDILLAREDSNIAIFDQQPNFSSTTVQIYHKSLYLDISLDEIFILEYTHE